MLAGDKYLTLQNFTIAILGPVAGYAGTVLKGWIEKSNVRAKRTDLCEDAARLITFHKTLAEATASSPRVQSAQISITDELDRVLEKLSQSLTAPPGSAGHPRSEAIVTLENWLLLYRPHGFFSWITHSLFFLMVPVWCLAFYYGFIGDLRTHAPDTGVGVLILLVLLLPIVLCNYVARKIDERARLRREAAQAVLPK